MVAHGDPPLALQAPLPVPMTGRRAAPRRAATKTRSGALQGLCVEVPGDFGQKSVGQNHFQSNYQVCSGYTL